MWFYFIIFLFLSFFCYINIKQKNTILWFLAFLLIIIAGFCGSISKDHDSYINGYNLITSGKLSNPLSFFIIAEVVNKIFHNSIFLFLLYAVLGVSLKIIAIKRLTEFWFFSILIYFSYYFFLHELTQLKAGVSAAFILLSIPSIYERKIKSFLIYAGLAIFFHFSAIVVLPLYFIKNDKMPIWYFFLIPIGYILFFTHANTSSLISLIDIDVIRLKYATYKSLNSLHKINVFNVLMLSRYVFCALLLWKWKFLSEKNIYSVILIKFYILSCFVFISFADIQGVAFRLSELLAIVEIILIPYIIYLVDIRLLGKLIVGFIGFLFLCLVLLYTKLVSGYF